jgi:hypothetical protein
MTVLDLGSSASSQPTPPCAICGHGGLGLRAPHHLTHGVSVWLCATHRSETFQRRRGGREFTERLGAVWAASGATSARRTAALRSHLRRVSQPPPARIPPGSYSWPRLRVEAERRFAAGEPPRRVIADLRRRHVRGTATVPSERTMRRWFADARWLRPCPSAGHAAAVCSEQRPARGQRRPAVPLLPPGFNRRPFYPWDDWWRGSG